MNLSFSKPFCGSIPIKKHPINNNLEGCFLFNEGGSKIIDCCKNFNPGILTNFQPSSLSGWVGGSTGKCLLFDGTDDHVDLGTKSFQSIVDNNKKYTILLWYTPGSSSGARNLFGLDIASAYFHIRQNGSGLEFLKVQGSDANQWHVYNSAITIGLYSFFAIVYDGIPSTSSFKVFRNGIQLSRSNGNTPSGNGSVWGGGMANLPVWFGGRYNAASNRLMGKVDQLRIYSRQLDTSEILALNSNPYLGIGGGRVQGHTLLNPDWAPHDPFGMLGIQGI